MALIPWASLFWKKPASKHQNFIGWANEASEVCKSTQKICPYARREISKTGDRISLQFFAVA